MLMVAKCYAVQEHHNHFSIGENKKLRDRDSRQALPGRQRQSRVRQTSHRVTHCHSQHRQDSTLQYRRHSPDANTARTSSQKSQERGERPYNARDYCRPNNAR